MLGCLACLFSILFPSSRKGGNLIITSRNYWHLFCPWDLLSYEDFRNKNKRISKSLSHLFIIAEKQYTACFSHEQSSLSSSSSSSPSYLSLHYSNSIHEWLAMQEWLLWRLIALCTAASNTTQSSKTLFRLIPIEYLSFRSRCKGSMYTYESELLQSEMYFCLTLRFLGYREKSFVWHVLRFRGYRETLSAQQIDCFNRVSRLECVIVLDTIPTIRGYNKSRHLWCETILFKPQYSKQN